MLLKLSGTPRFYQSSGRSVWRRVAVDENTACEICVRLLAGLIAEWAKLDAEFELQLDYPARLECEFRVGSELGLYAKRTKR